MEQSTSDDRSEARARRKPHLFDAQRGREAARKSAEVRKARATATRSPEGLGDLAMEDLAFVRRQALETLKRGRLNSRERVDLLKVVANVAETVLDRTRGRPRAEAPAQSGPEAYRQILRELDREAALGTDPALGELPQEPTDTGEDSYADIPGARCDVTGHPPHRRPSGRLPSEADAPDAPPTLWQNWRPRQKG